jgi:hypothetical protein
MSSALLGRRHPDVQAGLYPTGPRPNRELTPLRVSSGPDFFHATLPTPRLERGEASSPLALVVILAVIPPGPTAANQTALNGMLSQPELPGPYWSGLSGR